MFTKIERLISSRNLKPKKKEGFLKIISIFSFLGIMLGVAILIIVMSVMNGFKTELTNKILGLNPFTKRAQAKNASLKLIPKLISNLTMVLHKLGTFDHLTDASGVALLLFKTETNKPLK